MKKGLYYCSYWEHLFYLNYEICVSDIILSKGEEMAQIHIVIMKNCEVVRGMSSDDLAELECEIRNIICKTHYENDDFDSGTVKIWYYNYDGSQINPCDIPLRMAVTFYSDKQAILLEKSSDLRNDLYDLLKKFVRGFAKFD